ncbi:hypothetical protein Ptr902_02767 [Pyrenophora tritici-repentis]|nr:hypothetical protein L13192_08765 [Pyrenophora tritici-repentis]KAI2483827.1 hypothetical protein Ptr902_02767 [Pyrenophora tritici-repentis]
MTRTAGLAAGRVKEERNNTVRIANMRSIRDIARQGVAEGSTGHSYLYVRDNSNRYRELTCKIDRSKSMMWYIVELEWRKRAFSDN